MKCCCVTVSLFVGFFQIEMPAKINSKFCFLIQKIVILPNSLRGPIAFLVRFRFWFRLTSKISIQNFTSRNRFHWAATPLKPYKVGNICYMTYRYYSVLYFLNLSLKHFFPTENGNFWENIQIRRPLSFRVLTCRACPMDVLVTRKDRACCDRH